MEVVALVTTVNQEFDRVAMHAVRRELLEAQANSAGADPCGERREFHMFPYAGPMFSTPIHVTPGEVVERDGFVFADLLLDANSQ